MTPHLSIRRRHVRTRRRGPAAVAGPFDPGSLVVGPRHLRVGDAWVATLSVTGYPRTVYPGWLSPLTHHPGLVDVSLHITPIDPAIAAARLQRQLGRLESGRRSTAEHGRLLDPHVEAATEDAYTLADRVARAEAHLYATTLALTVHAATRADLDDEVAALRAVAASLLIDLRPTTWRTALAWWTGLPTGLNHLTPTPPPHPGRLGTISAGPVSTGAVGPGGRVMDTDALAYAFPFASPDLPTPQPTPAPHGAQAPGGSGDGVGGVFYGHNLGAAGSLLFWDRFALDNYNAIVLGRSGSGKSYLIKLELLRHLYRGVHAHVIDPESEFTRLATAVGGTIIRPGAPGVRLNPFELPTHTHPDTRARTAAPDTLRRRQLFLHTFLTVALGHPTPVERAVLDTAITTTYRYAGITDDPGTWTRPAPLLRDLQAALHHLARPQLTAAQNPHAGNRTANVLASRGAAAGDAAGDLGAAPDARGEELGEVAAGLAARLAPFVEGAFADLFAGPTTTPPAGHLVVWSLRELAEEVKPLGMLLVLDAIWRAVTHPHDRRPRLVTVDEAWLLLQSDAAARFLLRTAKSARKWWTGLTVSTQDVDDVLGSDLGRAVITNSATQILMGQAPQALDPIAAAFHLSAGQRAFLAAAERGHGLLLAGPRQAAFAASASRLEDDLITTDPEFLASLPDCGGNSGYVVLDPGDGGPEFAEPRGPQW